MSRRRLLPAPLSCCGEVEEEPTPSQNGRTGPHTCQQQVSRSAIMEGLIVTITHKSLLLVGMPTCCSGGGDDDKEQQRQETKYLARHPSVSCCVRLLCTFLGTVGG